jgi:hypothetical protein
LRGVLEATIRRLTIIRLAMRSLSIKSLASSRLATVMLVVLGNGSVPAIDVVDNLVIVVTCKGGPTDSWGFVVEIKGGRKGVAGVIVI